MRKTGAIVMIVAAAFLALGGCGKDEETATQTGARIQCLAYDTTTVRYVINGQTVIDTVVTANPCLTFALNIYIDDEFQGRMSSNERRYFPLPAGSHNLYAESNLVWDEIQRDAYYCFEARFIVNNDEMTEVVLDATHPLCVLGGN